MTASDIPKNPGGRPTTYRPEYCNQVIEWGAQGKSKAWMCANLKTTYETMDDWAKANPEFSEAITRAKFNAQAWWEDFGQEHMLTTGFSASAWSRSMAARFPSDWREKSEHTHQNPDGTGLMDPLTSMLSQIDGKTRTI